MSFVDKFAIPEILDYTISKKHSVLFTQCFDSTAADGAWLLTTLQVYDSAYMSLLQFVELCRVFEAAGQVDVIGHLLQNEVIEAALVYYYALAEILDIRQSPFLVDHFTM